MYCIIQEIERKRKDTHRVHKEIEVYSMSISGTQCYYWKKSDEVYDRPIKTAYKVTLRESYREKGKIKSKQWVLCTIGYYDMIEFCYYEYVEKKINQIAEETGKSFNDIYKIVEDKLYPLYERIKLEYQQTEAYKAEEEQKDIIRRHNIAEAAFDKIYGSGQYRFCYDVFGTLRNEAYLKALEERRRYQEKFYSNYNSNSYQEYFKSNYGSSSYQNNLGSNYNEEDKTKLKKCFKVLAKYFHPDNTTGDMELMQFVNDKLKKEWDL